MKYCSGFDKKYPYGIRYRPLYDASGRFKEGHDGKVGCCVVFNFTDPQLQAQRPNDVKALQDPGKLHIDPHIVHEEEVSFLGFIPQAQIGMRFFMEFPEFHEEYDGTVMEEYGLEEEEYETFKQAILKEKIDEPKFKKCIKKLSKSLENKITKYIQEF